MEEGEISTFQPETPSPHRYEAMKAKSTYFILKQSFEVLDLYYRIFLFTHLCVLSVVDYGRHESRMLKCQHFSCACTAKGSCPFLCTVLIDS